MNPVAQKMYEKTAPTPDTIVRVGVGVIIQNERGWILLEKRSDCGLWGLPGGKIEPGESIREAAVREAKEETGFMTEVIRLLGVYSEQEDRIVTYLDNGDVVHLVDILIEARITSGKLTCSPESEEVRFFDPSALPLDVAPPAIKPLSDFVRGVKGVIF